MLYEDIKGADLIKIQLVGMDIALL